MSRWARLATAIVGASSITGLYMMGGEYEVCGTECHSNPWGWKPFLIFVITSVVVLRLLKKIDDLNSRYE